MHTSDYTVIVSVVQKLVVYIFTKSNSAFKNASMHAHTHTILKFHKKLVNIDPSSKIKTGKRIYNNPATLCINFNNTIKSQLLSKKKTTITLIYK